MESIQSFGIHENTRLDLLIANLILIGVMTIISILRPHLIFLAILIFFAILLPICFVISFRKEIQLNCSGRVVRSRCPIKRDNREAAMEFLTRVDAARQERRHHLNGGR